MKLKKKKKQNYRKSKILDCYGIQPEGLGKISFGNIQPECNMRDLGDLGKI